MLSQEFITGGSAIFTIELTEAYRVACGAQPHYTYRVNFKEANGSFQDTYFVALLSGPNNTEDYTYLGILEKTGKVRLTGKSAYPEKSVPVCVIRHVLAAIWAGRTADIEAAGWKVHHEGRCGCCGRPLTVPESVEEGIGPICREKMGLPRLVRNGKPITSEDGDDPKPVKKTRRKKVKAQLPPDEDAPDLGDSVLLGPDFPDHDLLH